MSARRRGPRVIALGLGVQGRKRLQVAGEDAVATVDPVVPGADFKALEDVPLAAYDGALVCVPDAAKLPLLDWLLSHGKHVLVEKPLLAEDDAQLERLARLSLEHGAVCYTAYNHRFEPHFVRMRELLASGRLGQVYLVRMFYGNGTARDVRESPWRDAATGVLADLGSHLLDTVRFWLGDLAGELRLEGARRFENQSFDWVRIGASGPPLLELEATLLSWRNTFSADVYAERGSAHIESLCKWGPSSFRLRTRVLPSGAPPEETVTLTQPDPTWREEYRHWQGLCERREVGDLAGDRWLRRALAGLAQQAGAELVA